MELRNVAIVESDLCCKHLLLGECLYELRVGEEPGNAVALFVELLGRACDIVGVNVGGPAVARVAKPVPVSRCVLELKRFEVLASRRTCDEGANELDGIRVRKTLRSQCKLDSKRA